MKDLINKFKDKDVFIVAGGPSLLGFDFRLLDDKMTIAVNHSYEYLKNPSLLCCLDSMFTLSLLKKEHKLQDFKFPVLVGPQISEKGNNIYNVNDIALDPSDNTLDNLFVRRNSGGTTTALAISFALLAKASNIYLLGVDLYEIGLKKHFYSQDFIDKGIWEFDPSDNERLCRLVDTFEAFKGYKNIFNLSEFSRLKTFEKKKIEEILYER